MSPAAERSRKSVLRSRLRPDSGGTSGQSVSITTSACADPPAATSSCTSCSGAPGGQLQLAAATQHAEAPERGDPRRRGGRARGPPPPSPADRTASAPRPPTRSRISGSSGLPSCAACAHREIGQLGRGRVVAAPGRVRAHQRDAPALARRAARRAPRPRAAARSASAASPVRAAVARLGHQHEPRRLVPPGAARARGTPAPRVPRRGRAGRPPRRGRRRRPPSRTTRPRCSSTSRSSSAVCRGIACLRGGARRLPGRVGARAGEVEILRHAPGLVERGARLVVAPELVQLLGPEREHDRSLRRAGGQQRERLVDAGDGVGRASAQGVDADREVHPRLDGPLPPPCGEREAMRLLERRLGLGRGVAVADERRAEHERRARPRRRARSARPRRGARGPGPAASAEAPSRTRSRPRSASTSRASAASPSSRRERRSPALEGLGPPVDVRARLAGAGEVQEHLRVPPDRGGGEGR